MRPCAVPLLAAALSAAAPALQAADEAAEAPAPAGPGLPEISGTLGAGAVAASGNTDSRSVNVDLAASFAWAIWRHKLELSGYQASEDGEDTAERYDAAVQSDYRFGERDYLFARAAHQSDRFGAFDRQTSLTAGYGRRVLDTGAQSLDLEAGGGRRVSEPDGTNDRNYENVVRLNGEYAWAFAANSGFTQRLELEAGEDNTQTESVSAVRSRLVADLALRISHTVTHNSDVPAGTEKTDTFTAIAVEYAF